MAHLSSDRLLVLIFESLHSLSLSSEMLKHTQRLPD